LKSGANLRNWPTATPAALALPNDPGVGRTSADPPGDGPAPANQTKRAISTAGIWAEYRFTLIERQQNGEITQLGPYWVTVTVVGFSCVV
jgi:ketosteroid isomerase-like protein